MEIKCIKAECPICKVTGSIQLFMNNNLEVRYARVRHYSHIDKDSKKPQFIYCKIEDLKGLKTLLKSKGISLSVDEAKSGQKLGQGQTDGTHDPEHSENGSIQQNQGGRRLVWFRTLAFQANDPGFKSRRPHQNISHHKLLLAYIGEIREAEVLALQIFVFLFLSSAQTATPADKAAEATAIAAIARMGNPPSSTSPIPVAVAVTLCPAVTSTEAPLVF